jgi:hypothetical protein
MRKLITLFALIATIMTFSSCSENYSNGTRIGTVNKFSKSGLIWKSWEGHMNLTQTGMTSTASDFEFSLDNDNEPEGLVKVLDSAMNYGWKVELSYHETAGKNWLNNRGSTNHFITSCKVMNRNFSNNISDMRTGSGKCDTVVMITIPYDSAKKKGWIH